MKLIVGLGNPEEKYFASRHNVGHDVVEEFQKMKPPQSFVVKKTSVYMNESGSFVKNLIEKYKLDPSDLYIIHDDLDIPLGSFKIQFGIGPKIHNGVNSVEQELGTKDFWRVRVGIENRATDSNISGEEYVLQDFTDDEKKIIDGVISEVCKKLATLSKNTN
ncbi:MAG: aminoacyl-tRNA hydrolase [Candidatus Microgenomates bacterium]|jgi:PTH1 family peptidyl-tRNA hydrolase